MKDVAAKRDDLADRLEQHANWIENPTLDMASAPKMKADLREAAEALRSAPSEARTEAIEFLMSRQFKIGRPSPSEYDPYPELVVPKRAALRAIEIASCEARADLAELWRHRATELDEQATRRPDTSSACHLQGAAEAFRECASDLTRSSTPGPATEGERDDG